MSLRSRLLAGTAALLAVALVASGLLVVRQTRAGLIDQVDQRLRAAGAPGGALARDLGPGPSGDPSGRQLAVILYDEDGTVVASSPSGFASDPDPLPDIPTSRVTAQSGRGEGPFTVRAVDDSLDYRVVIAPARGGERVALAAPLDGVDETISSLARDVAAIGAIVLAILLGAGWLLLRRGLRPLESMAETADRIAHGDLAHRVGPMADTSDVGRLGTALDAMLDRIETAFEERERSERQLRQFVADASHELRTPLTTLRGYVELYRAGALAERADLDAALGRIGAESGRMATLVDDLLLLARLDQGRPLERAPVDVSRLVGEAVADLRAVEPDRPVSAEVESGVSVEADADRLRQVLANLLGNVRSHTPRQTPVELRLARTESGCELAVADHGPGIPPEHAERIFDRFYRADPSRARDAGGSGLGLAIARAVVRSSGGTIRHEPTPGGGATFVVSLPGR